MNIVKEISAVVLLVLLSCLSTAATQLNDHSCPLVLGSLQFPYSVEQIPVPRIYFLGKTIPCEIHKSERKITFDIPKNRFCKECYLLITESIDYTLKKSKYMADVQAIDHIKVPQNQPYKFYRLTLVKDPQPDSDLYYWKVAQEGLPNDSRRIPDETIIILYTPDYVAQITGGSLLELPTIVMKSDIVALAGSQDALFEQSIALQLASLNSDTIHAPLKHAIKQLGSTTLIAPTT